MESTFGSRLRAARQRVVPKLTQERLAQDVGTTHMTISNWERDEVDSPDSVLLAKIAARLSVSVDWLIRGDVERDTQAAADLVRYPALDEFLATPQGQGATPDEIAELEAEQYSHGSPTVESYSFKLMSIRARARGKGSRDPDPVNPTLPEGTMRRKSKR